MTDLPMIDHRTSRSGRWLRSRRMRIALWIAVIEAIVVAFEASVSRWTVILLAAAAIALYFWGSRSLSSDTGRQILWIAAASQALAVTAVLLAFIVGVFVLALAVVFAVIALVLILSDRR
jgi:hypothetical protein